MNKHLRRAFAITALLVIGLVTAAALFLFTADYNRYKDLFADAITDATGRKAVIGGNLGLAFSLPPELAVADVTLANAPWGSQPQMAQLGELRLRVRLLPLLKRKVDIAGIRLIDTDLLFETDAKGRSNWQFSHKPSSDRGIAVRDVMVEQLDVERLAITLRGADTGSPAAQYKVDSLSLSHSSTADSLTVSLRGSFNGQSLALSGQTGLLKELLAGARFPLNLSGEIGAASVTIHGEMGNALKLEDIQLELKGSGSDLAELSSIVGQTLPATGAFEVSGKLTGTARALALSGAQGTISQQSIKLSVAGKIDDLNAVEGISLSLEGSGKNLGELGAMLKMQLPDLGSFSIKGQLSGSARLLDLQNFSATVDKSDFSGWAKVELGKRPKLTAKLESAVVDFTRILQQTQGDKTVEKEERHAEGDESRQVLFSNEPLPFDVLKAVDADIAFSSRNIKAQDAELELGQLALRLTAGDLQVQKLEVTYNGAKVSANLNLMAGSPAKVAVRFLVQGFDLGRFLKDTHLSQEVAGKVDVAAHLKSQGDSPHRLMANLDGSFGAVFGKGQVPRILDFLAEDLSQRVIPIWGRHKKSGQLNCGLFQFSNNKGIATSDAFLFDTAVGILKGRGEINFETEQLDFVLAPKPHDPSLFSLATKLHVTGSVLNPKVAPDRASLLKKGSKALSALVLGPAGLLLPFIELGARHKHPCDIQQLMSRVQTIYNDSDE